MEGVKAFFHRLNEAYRRNPNDSLLGEIIRRLMEQKETHAYTIQKGEVRKLIYQTPWYKDGELAGLVEFSLVLPEDMPHYVREVKP